MASDNRTLYFNRPADTPQARYVIELLQTAYQQLGYQLELVDFNRQSALIAANDGALDGQLGRIHGVTQAYPNLLKVRFPLYTFNLQLLSRCLSCTFQQLDSLVIQSGYLVANQYLETTPFNGQLIEVKNNITQLNLVTQGKVQAALVVDFHLREYLADIDLESFKIETLLTIETFHYLHQKHKTLIPQLEQALNQLAKKGTVTMLKAKYQI
ncbi:MULTISPECIES: transporter substrate-binding domain-containing protein [unclassified Pseudoalteromonas]|uniref:substrate-binding periplasmic protein n=1 Tax=unclassified Pseudoalteromonas TaxID=194690 RepID=UPI002097FA97|nr:transporter substrate-binding domain-containing protein [Pseudoalteromonas sp. XMcav2-N]MCO7189705.1 transporter substrate-binding domain-containing protein [Pseudoalteromonas sp. XMcav2-N]